MLNVALAWLRLAQQSEARDRTDSPPIAPDDCPTSTSCPPSTDNPPWLTRGWALLGRAEIGYDICDGSPHGKRAGCGMIGARNNKHPRRPGNAQ